ncbi:zinc-finger domain-containing protein [Granulibacter bethesdensis]|uniref:Cytosolic protein n=1 Tax=Granulibacter bethesdensis (strain ATCC BAA-1260 / CGDNIH1) TaxID=391165 RepID=Q0BQP0_GRABC|nr:zinc-finger domain-containing protein [Granulibacter bethesdensis]ABI62862.1 putative cytosolic protein [Granulibacter bethesdensis CGDNIH1]AHJ68182.1 putative cytosolic protein [Granulibacter bethesdensis]APH52729.1 putative cytosolic protein [Granulibacter bethesdensis]APH65417.1 putative cytosolic protein [Granulibacter bethesdensis]
MTTQPTNHASVSAERGEPTPVAPAGLNAPASETILVDSHVVSCDGGNAPLGHPRVWLRIAGQRVMCPYCSRLYVLTADAPAVAAH